MIAWVEIEDVIGRWYRAEIGGVVVAIHEWRPYWALVLTGRRTTFPARPTDDQVRAEIALAWRTAP